MTEHKKTAQQRRQRVNRVRSKLSGTAKRPRLSVNISNRSVLAQLIDDEKSVSITSVTSLKAPASAKTMTEKAEWVGKEIAKQAKAKKINTAILDRRFRQYHGRIKALADASREAGLEI